MQDLTWATTKPAEVQQAAHSRLLRLLVCTFTSGQGHVLVYSCMPMPIECQRSSAVDSHTHSNIQIAVLLHGAASRERVVTRESLPSTRCSRQQRLVLRWRPDSQQSVAACEPRHCHLLLLCPR